jgi:hypothetical protein
MFSVGRELRPTALVVLLASLAEAVDPQWRAVHERRRLVAPISEAAQNRRTLERFTRGHPDNQICWDRDGLDGFINVIDAHQHPVPFGGPEVPFSLYTDWFIQHGTVFSVFMGIGQRIVKQNASAPDCCYYMHCPTYDYPVIPSAIADEVNAVAKLEHYYGKVRIRTSSRCMQVLTTTPPPSFPHRSITGSTSSPPPRSRACRSRRTKRSSCSTCGQSTRIRSSGWARSTCSSMGSRATPSSPTSLAHGSLYALCRASAR